MLHRYIKGLSEIFGHMNMRPSNFEFSLPGHTLRILPVIMVSILLISSGCSLFQESSAPEEAAALPEYDPDFTAYTQSIPDTDVTIDMVPVLGGEFMMGRSTDEPGMESHEGPPSEVEVSSFWMSSHEITWDQYELYSKEVVEADFTAELLAEFGLEADAIALPSPPYGDEAYGMGRDNRPAISITQYAALTYAMWLTAKTGEFHRLPTEAEWEYACRGGVYGGYDLESDPDLLDQHEWYAGNSDGSYNPVAVKEPNPLGLYDMKGNIAEWTMDQYYEDYHERLNDQEVALDPWFKPDELYPRAVRGGSWRDSADDIRCTQRRGSEQRWKRGDPQIPKSMWWHTNASFLGFRIVRPLETPTQEEMEEYWIEPMWDI